MAFNTDQRNGRAFNQRGLRPQAPLTNPYAFVPFGLRPDRSDITKRYGNQRSLLTGWLDVKLTAKTRLIIPDAARAVQNHDGMDGHRLLPFFRAPEGGLMIPGSELRGLLRTAYETASNSCVPFVLDDRQTSMRLPLYVSIQNRGLLGMENGRWVLWKANDWAMAVNQKDLDEIRAVGMYRQRKPGGFYYFRQNGSRAELCGAPGPGVRTGWIQFSVPIVDRIVHDPDPRRAKHYSVHMLTRASRLCEWDDETPFLALKEELDHDGDEQRKTVKDAAAKIHRELLARLKRIQAEGKGALPVWYIEVEVPGGKRYYLSPSSIGRINQLQRWKDIMGEYAPCRCGEESCPACQLFGQTSGDWSARGRIRVGDALPDGRIETAFATLPILGTPRPTAFEMYIRKPESAKFWNYDIRAEKAGREADTVFSAREDFAPRGRKYYWHSSPRAAEKKSGLNATAEYAREGAAFTFRVFFDRITKNQLAELIWMISLGENRQTSELCHKLGHGKPVGYGSVKLTVEGLTVRKLDLSGGGYSLKEKRLPEQIPCPFPRKNQKQLAALLAVSRLHAVGQEQTDYPHLTPGGDIFQWFAENHKNANRVQVLLEISELTSLPAVRFAGEAEIEALLST